MKRHISNKQKPLKFQIFDQKNWNLVPNSLKEIESLEVLKQAFKNGNLKVVQNVGFLQNLT